MEQNLKQAIEQFQCNGCSFGSDVECGNFNKANFGIGCNTHIAGTIISGIGVVLQGMPKGFCRYGENGMMHVVIHNNYEADHFDNLNIPVWKYFYKDCTLVKIFSPRINKVQVYVYLENCIDKINCFEVTDAFLETID